MSTWKKFEDINAWQMARKLANRIFKLLQNEAFARDFKLKNQLLASSGSIMDNIAEGFERGGNKEFIQFLYVSKGSAGELRSQLYRCFDFGYITEDELEILQSEVIGLSNQISGIIRYLKSSKLKGDKFK